MAEPTRSDHPQPGPAAGIPEAMKERPPFGGAVEPVADDILNHIGCEVSHDLRWSDKGIERVRWNNWAMASVLTRLVRAEHQLAAAARRQERLIQAGDDLQRAMYAVRYALGFNTPRMEQALTNWNAAKEATAHA
jgi:hypothetical protein